MKDETVQELETRRYFASGLLEWYGRSKRDLPWRRTKNPYYIWVSEVMLQQTRVDTVIPYYHRFLEKFPDVEALASAPEEEVLKAWEGLGYYSRARNLQSAVREVHERYGGVVPDQKEEISSLKGVGPYTAGAVLSIAYNRPEPAVDGNVMRVLSRYFLIKDDIAKGSTRVKMERLARELIPEGRAGDFNQALMELGATVCTPRSPHCLTCPVMERCRGRLEGQAEELPVKAKAKPPRVEPRAVALIAGDGEHAGKLLIRRRPRQGLLANMWELPHIEVERPARAAERRAGSAAAALSEAAAGQGSAAARRGAEMEALAAGLAETDGITALPERWLMDAEHIFSHIRWELAVYRCRLDPRFEAAGLPPHYRWLDAGEMERYAFPNVFLRILAEVGIDQA
ncbi:A/G-specific adenine glycosylase [Paenibacillus sp. J2TS4]|uniref:A/G-specific adenine glycosylase n=1 Tax=Paenibacillus sp. J2TS4 TaxID=2807194 RepID=UPI001B1556CC|nr:A/G-specific adenine glycosylase [Paenibacillus sp. J2TS4]GIP34744.1 A/G-specific adenine glycosylase [Paenibacillus sp. J2TS4]